MGAQRGRKPEFGHPVLPSRRNTKGGRPSYSLTHIVINLLRCFQNVAPRNE